MTPVMTARTSTTRKTEMQRIHLPAAQRRAFARKLVDTLFEDAERREPINELIRHVNLRTRQDVPGTESVHPAAEAMPHPDLTLDRC